MNNGIKALAPGTLQPNYTSGSSHYLAPRLLCLRHQKRPQRQ